MTYTKLYNIADVLAQPNAILDWVDLSGLKLTKEGARIFYSDRSSKECKNPKKYGFVAGWTKNVIWPKDAKWLHNIAGNEHSDSFEDRKICIPAYPLHQENLTGKGIGISVIYTEINPEHIEYSGNIAHYESLYNKKTEATINGCALASTAVGKTCGAAPDSKLHYFATPFDKDATSHTDALNRVIEHNRTLSEHEKIRFLVCPWNDKDRKKYPLQKQLFKQCEKEGIMVIGGGQRTFRANLVTYSKSFCPQLREAGFGVCIDDHVVAHPNGTYVLLRYGGVPAAMACIAGGLACLISGTPEFCDLKNWQKTLINMTMKGASRETQHFEFCPGNIINWVQNTIYER